VKRDPNARVRTLTLTRPERAARRLALELDEDEVPQLEHVRVVPVDQRRRVAPADLVRVRVRARVRVSAGYPTVARAALGLGLARAT